MHVITSILIYHTKEIIHKQTVILNPKHKDEEMRNVDLFENSPIEHLTSGPEI